MKKLAAGFPIGISVLAIVVAGALLFYTFHQPADADASEPTRLTRSTPDPGKAAPPRRLAPHVPGRIITTVPTPPRPSEPAPVEREQAQDTPLALLPPNTLIAAVATDYLTLMQTTGAVDLLERHRTALAEAEEELANAGLVPRDFIEPTSLGVDASAPMVLAVIGVDEPIVVLGARIQDEARLAGAIGTIAATYQLEDEDLDGATLTTGKSDKRFGFLRRAGLVYVLIADGYRSDISTVAAQLAYQAPEDSLITTQSWASAFEGVHGKEGWLFLSGPALFAEVESELREDIERDRKMLEEAEAKQEQDGSNEAERGDLNRWQREHLARQEGALTMFQAFFGGIGGMGVGFEFEGGNLLANGHLGLTPGSLMARLMRNRTGPSALMRALDTAPMFAMDGALDQATLQELVRLFSAAIGADLERGLMLVKAFGATDKDPMALLSGDFGFALTTELDDNQQPTVHMVLTADVTDRELAQTLINNLGGLATMAGAVAYDEQTGGVTFQVPGWHTLYLALVGNTVILTSRAVAVDRLSRNASPIYDLTRNARADQLLNRSGQAGMMLMDYQQMIELMNPRHDDGVAKAVEVQFGGNDEPGMHQARIAELDRELAEANRQRRQTERTRLMTFGSLLGRSVMVGHQSSGGLRFEGGWFTEVDSAADMLAALVDFVVLEETERKAYWKRDQTLHAERTRLVQEQIAAQPPRE